MVILYDFVGGAWKYFDAYPVGIRVFEPQYGYDVPSWRRVGRCTFVGCRAVAYGQFASVGYIDAVHEATKQRAVGRGVMQSVVVYEIMYHLVDDGVVDGVGCEVETGGDAQLEVGVFFTSVGQRNYP